MAEDGEPAQVVEFRAAAEAAVECIRSPTRFVNDSEVVLNRFHRSVQHLLKAKLAEGPQVFESVTDKDETVHFVLQCVRNRFLLWEKVSLLKDQLIEGHKSWEKAFKQHLSQCETCQTVDLKREKNLPEPPVRTRPKRPVPFCLELLALIGLAFPLFALGQGCDCKVRYVLLPVGLLFCLPVVIFETIWWRKRRWILWHLIPGDYAVDAPRTRLSCSWWPSLTGEADVENKGGKDGGERQPSSVMQTTTPKDATHRRCVTFGQWFPHEIPVSSGTIQKVKSVADDDRWRVKLESSVTHWKTATVVLGSKGSMGMAGQEAIFDGHTVVVTSTGDGSTRSVWTKLGPRRLELVRKVLYSVAAVGVVIVTVAVAFHPGITSECGPQRDIIRTTVRTPLRAVFILDASASVSADQFAEEIRATDSILDAFIDVYRPQEDRVFAAVGQFSTTSTLEVELTSNHGLVKTAMFNIDQNKGGTVFSAGLRVCQDELDRHAATTTSVPGSDFSARETFDMCVLITDGDGSEDVSSLKAILRADTRLMGIYVGTSQQSANDLRDITSCGSEGIGSQGAMFFSASADGDVGLIYGFCPFFAKTENFEELRNSAKKLAQDIAVGLEQDVNETVITYTCDTPWWTLLGLVALLPLLVLWCYLRSSLLRGGLQRHGPHVHKDPSRLHTAGSDQARSSILGKTRA
eukprot:TRINITY_DN56136_c0_g1_i1.p1 TRINITY_DN56136_c0_g1~~TRINITY_DN56136_c0_g1_i1.p1  ORF type:complete len:731 (+),score=107.59 TRINITY_DN56136_c0_g1_i1:124-2193(+)